VTATDGVGTRAVLTLAVGRPLYVRLAVNLARSFRHWHPEGELPFVLATDQPAAVPRDVLRFARIHVLRPGELGEGFSPKLHLDTLAPADQTLFLDADSLCVGSLDVMFQRFAGHPVSVIAGRITAGEWFGDVARVCRHFGVDALPKFNGGVYYVERGPQCSAVYEIARSLEPRYDDLGLVRLRGRPNDELLLAIALARQDLWGIPDDGTLMAEPLNFACGLSLDVLAGGALLRNTPGHARYQAHWPLTEARPRVVHFLGSHTDGLPYAAEAIRLEKAVGRRWPRWAADVAAFATQTIPKTVVSQLKRALRPTYHALFGYRPVAPSQRI
jgi:hypothetical protein